MKKLVFLLAGVLLALTARAATAITLSDFSSFTPTYYGFDGSWSADTAQSGSATFSIGNFGSGVARNDGSFTKWLSGEQDFSSYNFVNLSGSVLAGNLTDSVSFFVEDADQQSGVATFQLANFSAGYSSVSLASLFSLVDATHVVNWGFSTENQFPLSNFAFAFDDVSLSASPIPEPSTYAAMAGGLSLLAAMIARRRTRTSV